MKNKKPADSPPEQIILKNSDIFDVLTGLNEISILEISDFKTAYAISRNINNLSTAEKALVKVSTTLLKKHTTQITSEEFEKLTPAEKQKIVWMDKKTYHKFNHDRSHEEYDKESADLYEQALTDTKLFHLKISDLQNIPKITARSLSLISKIITEDEEILG